MKKNCSRFQLMYYAKQVSGGNGWHVIDPDGNPITDLVFRDEDAAMERVEMHNDALDLQGAL